MTRNRDHLLVDALLLLALGAALLWAAVSGAQPAALNLNGQPLTAIRCDGGVVCSRRGSVATIIVTASGSGGSSSNYDGGYLVVQDEGSNLTKRTTLDFTGAGVACTDTGSKTSCDIPGGGGGAGQSPLSVTLGTP